MVNKKNSKPYIFMVFVLTVIILIYLFGNSFNTIEVNNLNSDQFEDILNSENVFVINAHLPYIGEIEGTDLIAEDWENMQTYVNQLPENKNTPIAIYCRSGRMSAISAEQLIEMGYENIYNLEGGMKLWEENGKSIIIKESKEFNVVAKNWEFIPGTIEVNQGDRVILHLESIDTFHGIALPDFNVNAQLPPGEIIDIEFIADKQGTFNFFCSVPCGSGHKSMGGQLIVN